MLEIMFLGVRTLHQNQYETFCQKEIFYFQDTLLSQIIIENIFILCVLKGSDIIYTAFYPF